MIEIILILIVLQILVNIIFKPNYNTLNCGLIGWAGKNPKQFNKYKFDILGIFNDSRGGDSCGVSTDGEIYYGIDKDSKHYKDFLVNKGYLLPKTLPVVIGHTRRSSSGVINETNAHPFGFGVNEKYESYAFIGAHNGTLYNHDEFCKNYDVDINVKDSNGTWLRRKIDSEVLLECIYQSKNFKVLSEYQGGAALLFYNISEPNIIYAFHGASKEYNNTKEIEERPLYYYKENKNSLYISSIAESLVAIGGEFEKNVFSFECNLVYKITDGDIDNAETFKVSRSNVTQKKVYTSSVTTNRHHGYRDDDYYDNSEFYSEYDNRNFVENNKHQNNNKSKKEKEGVRESDITNIYNDQVNPILPSPINFNKLRYYRNGHLVNGIHIFVPKYGLVWLESEVDKANQKVLTLLSKPFDLKAGMFIDNADFDFSNPNHFIPFKASEGNIPQMHYIHEGVMLINSKDYEMAKAMKLKDHSKLVFASKHPLIDITYVSKSKEDIIYHKENEVVLFTGKISPLGSNKIYEIENGSLVSIIFLDKLETKEKETEKETSIIQLPINFDKPLEEFLDEQIIDKSIKEEEDETETSIEVAIALDAAITQTVEHLQNINFELSLIEDDDIVEDLILLNKNCIQTYGQFLDKHDIIVK